MFNFFKKKNMEVYSPVIGEVKDLEKVADKVFSTKMMGEGVAFDLSDDTVTAPIDGEITLLPDSKHAFGLKGANGIEILVHVGLDTVNLNGEGFTSLVSAGDNVKKGDGILKVDREFIKSKGIDLTTPMIITNSNDFVISLKYTEGKVNRESLVLECNTK